MLNSIIITLALLGPVDAQSQVRCESLLYPGTIQVFNGGQCPRGWVPV